MAEITATPTAVAARDEGFLNAGISASATTITVAAITKYVNGVKTTQGFDTTGGFAEMSQGGKTELISFGAVAVDATTNVTTLTDVRRGLSITSTTQSLTAGTGSTFKKGARIAVVDSANYIQTTSFTDAAKTFTAKQTFNIVEFATSGDEYLQLPSLTTTERNALTAANGMLIYNETTSQLNQYIGGSWEPVENAAAADKVKVDTGATADFIGAADSDGVLRTGDGLSYTDGGDFVTLDVTMLKDASATELTISSGSITRTGSAHTVDTESDAASDDLTTIAGGTDGDYITIWAADDGRTVVVKNGSDNILTADGADFSIDTDDKAMTLRYDGSNWKEVSRATADVGEVNNKKLFLSAQDLTPAATGGATAVAAKNDDFAHLSFDGSTNNTAMVNFILPGDYTDGSTITAKAIWATGGNDTNDVEWDLYCDALDDGAAADDAYTQSAVTITDAGGGTGNLTKISPESGAITIGNTAVSGDLCKFRVTRDAANDSHNTTALLIGILITYS